MFNVEGRRFQKYLKQSVKHVVLIFFYLKYVNEVQRYFDIITNFKVTVKMSLLKFIGTKYYKSQLRILSIT